MAIFYRVLCVVELCACMKSVYTVDVESLRTPVKMSGFCNVEN